MVIPGIIWLVIFCYIPMYGIIIAFQDYTPGNPFWGGSFVGFKHFIAFFNDKYAIQAVWNTLRISFIKLIVTFPAPIIFALLLNEVTSTRFKKLVQSVSYLPYFISWVVMWGLLYALLNINGPLNTVLEELGILDEHIAFLARVDAFIPIAVLSDLWKGVGWSSILYLAAISNVPQDMYEAAYIDGASRLQRCLHITLPSIMPTVTIMLILAVSGILGSNFDQHLLLQNANNVSVARTIDVYVYNMGLQTGRYSYATAVNLARSIVSFFLLYAADRLSRWVSHGERGLF
ncbi:MAG: sugar ABC transporter permease [Lachnospiraceae bacterium]|nr:sugar ABC transporter permease [Lachnospiraceae bacterium]